ncbi:hypothetical protein CANARDRAFT_7806 [[Candida] arabinofermentans NRRL YB-2248]|uniref:Histone deacetylase complex subunit SAP30 Sin3 binding domain-containing protein n=1 Tax=[Candida] arabinofermentans NRRL YB-2248 TaxID=983967 RepID=A0A1E4T095_9ASCO|nr:hypothetical protein CANARDRAFT_7806 [[Candida] arabinofermentans NRRL YB-2248]
MAKKDHNSESESNAQSTNLSHTPSASRSSTKQRNQMLAQQQKEFLAKYIHSNGPDDFEKPGPLDFSTWTESQLRKYRELYLTPNQMISSDTKTFQGYLLEGSQLGENSESYIKNETNKEKKVYDYRTVDDLRANVEDHFNNHLNVKESEVIMNFIYSVKNENKKFKMCFDKRT